ncbi:hypothetical protein L211DRAFT_853586 [Terfezia boudieri ATCC MYA-4762]|uniref:Uncharacterized protein n=1 Tax=Terfezia boudieri ATCC MYA-4762 TaxID=1051890 RepID=A0A3N4L8T1_9PEZI|nr:hypothetical protein L211DRAFT_853586 [Terfezia boudieri ATCC MYA-4762]
MYQNITQGIPGPNLNGFSIGLISILLRALMEKIPPSRFVAPGNMGYDGGCSSINLSSIIYMNRSNSSYAPGSGQSGEKNTMEVQKFLELLELFFKGLETQISDAARRERVVKVFENPRAQVLQNQLSNQNQFRGSYLQQAQIQSARDQTPYTQTVAYVERLSDEDLGLVPKTDPAGMVTIADELVVNESQSEGSYLKQVQSAIDRTSHTQTITVAYIDHLSREDSRLVSKTDPAGIIAIASELAEIVEKEADLEN